MTLGEMIRRCRLLSRDEANPPLWSDDTWRAYLNDAAREAAIRGCFIERIFKTEAKAGIPYSPFPKLAFSIRKIRMNGHAIELVDRIMLDDEYGNWEDRSGEPRTCLLENSKLRWFPVPETDMTASVVAYVTPEEMIETKDSIVGIPDRLHSDIVHFALALAYQEHDSDGFDQEAAQFHEEKFNGIFGMRLDEHAMRDMTMKVKRHVKGEFF